MNRVQVEQNELQMAAELHSLSLLNDVVEENDNMILQQKETKITLFVKGVSRRWYKIDAKKKRFIETWRGSNLEARWDIRVSGATRKKDILETNEYTADLCIHSESRILPIGDQLVGLGLALTNDKKTALMIPLLAQFIVCPREEFSDIALFQEEGIIFETELCNPPEYEIDYDEEQVDYDRDYEEAMERIADSITIGFEPEEEDFDDHQIFNQYFNHPEPEPDRTLDDSAQQSDSAQQEFDFMEDQAAERRRIR